MRVCTSRQDAENRTNGAKRCHLPPHGSIPWGETGGTKAEPPSQGVARAAPGRAHKPPLLGQARPGSGGQLGSMGRVRPCVGDRRGACTLARHHGADRQRPALRTGVTARCPSCHAIIKRACALPVAIHWPCAPPICPSLAWLHPIEPGSALGRCSGKPLRSPPEIYKPEFHTLQKKGVCCRTQHK
jgi:hypothetical protein